MTELIVTIMAGGKGERFWPYSRTDKPKQFLRVSGDKTLLQQTVDRALKLTKPENIYIVTDQAFVATVAEQVQEVPTENILIEPFGRDTAPCLALAALHLENKYPSSLMVVLAADHLIIDVDKFCQTVHYAAKVAEHLNGLVTIGIKPSRPETGYGYIKSSCELDLQEQGFTTYKVEQFAEKPDIGRALHYLQSGEYLWNSGMFVWKTSVLMNCLQRYCLDIYERINQLKTYLGQENYYSTLEQIYKNLPKISIDYAILEKEDKIYVVPGEFGWDDLGTWTSLERVNPTDDSGNLIQGNVVMMETKDSIIRSESDDKLIVTFGLENALVVDTPDVLLVADKGRTQDLKAVLKELKENGLESFLTSVKREKKEGVDINSLPWDCKTKEKPWGREVWWSVTEKYVGKVLFVKAGQCLSKQYHEVKSESMVFTTGSGYIEINDKKLAIRPGLVVDIPAGTVHRVEAITDVTILEVSTPELDDVVRLEDKYGRNKHLAAGE
ncbi:mannose-1-phosphate guanylyltransferase/mannose-6-phosphate isomerase [Desulfotomaculum sp. 1211_IL3151]|uniref:mannose-1-phosphate guanylyltransferase/mannose-6-phosphate isomerase n=1 Tax=Desulfotomaculum sp. 1211_IL3151 TaxID=3084055 RepID=UPI002FD976BE